MEKISDIELFNELFTKYKSRFIRFAKTFTRDDAIAEDFVIDALVYYWEHRTELSEESNVPAYVLTIIKHKCFLTSSMRHPKQKSHLDGSKSDLIARCFSVRKSVFVK